jgi:predicted nucleic acid-binding protein
MIVVDVNLLLYAVVSGFRQHDAAHAWRLIQNYFQPSSTTRVSAGQVVEQDHVKGGFE